MAGRRPAASPPQGPAETWTVFDRPGKFITALCAADDALWIGTEDMGLWRLDLSADPTKPSAWKQFIGKDGPNTEHVYAIAVDAAGRVWVGTTNQGVAVYDGLEWRTFGVLDGCGGERVFAIAADADSKRGHVWIGTDHGLVCWSPSFAEASEGKPGGTGGSSASAPHLSGATAMSAMPDAGLCAGTWRTYTRADGLPSDQIYALAVAPTGRVWVGTECDGLAWSDPPYKKWTCVRAAAERSGDSGEAPGLNGGTGPGLPSNLSNDLLVLRDGTVVYSTNYGLGMGRGGGLTWTSWQGLLKQPYANYCRGLAEDPSGRLWIATRHLGLARLDGRTGNLKSYRRAWRPEAAKPGEPPKVPPSLPDDYVFDVAVTADGDVWAGTYGGGLARLKGAVPAAKSASSLSAVSAKPQSFPSLPAPAAPPTLAELNAILSDLAKVPFVPPENQPQVVRLDDDWLTKGDWLGRYGRYWACLAAMRSPEDVMFLGSGYSVDYTVQIGPNCARHDSVRYWVHWLYSDDRRVLEMPPDYLNSRIRGGLTTEAKRRRQAEWDDHGEVYSMSRDGPDTFCTVEVPEGWWLLLLYFFNKDGHSETRRFRDFTIEVKSDTPIGRWFGHQMDHTVLPSEMAAYEKMPCLASSRVRDFCGGVHKRFLLRGPARYTLRIGRNHSFNTTFSSLMLDRLEMPDVTGLGGRLRWSGGKLDLKKWFVQDEEGGVEAGADRLLERLEMLRARNAPAWSLAREKALTAALRSYRAAMRARISEGGELPPDLYERILVKANLCQFGLGLIQQWEKGCDVLELTTPREVLLDKIQRILPQFIDFDTH